MLTHVVQFSMFDAPNTKNSAFGTPDASTLFNSTYQPIREMKQIGFKFCLYQKIISLFVTVIKRNITKHILQIEIIYIYITLIYCKLTRLNHITLVSLAVALKGFPLVFSNNNPFNHKNHSNSASMDNIYVTYFPLSLLAISQEHLPHLKAQFHLV